MKKRKVLVIEDDRAISGLLVHMLEGQDFEVQAAFDGLEGLSKTKEFQPELIILDVNMPLMNGWQLLKTLKSSSKTYDIPIIMCTEHSLMKEVEDALSNGAAGYIMKPFTTERVMSKIMDQLGPDEQ